MINSIKLFLLSPMVKRFRKLVNVCRSYGQLSTGSLFMKHGVSGGSRISELGGKDEAPQAPRFSRHRREDRGAEGVGCGEGVSPSPENF